MAGSASPLPSDPAAALYRGESGRAYHQGKRGIPEIALPWVHRLRAEKFRPWVGRDATVVELGVGGGWNLASLPCARRIGCDAVDHPELPRQLSRLGIEFVPTLDAVADASADVVLCHHTLEHLLEPARALSDFRRILRPRGVLVLHVPWEIERRYATYRPDEPNHHLQSWNAQTLGNLASVLGWHIQRIGIRRYGYDRFSAKWAARLHLGERSFRALRWILIQLFPLREVELVATVGPMPVPSPIVPTL